MTPDVGWALLQGAVGANAVARMARTAGGTRIVPAGGVPSGAIAVVLPLLDSARRSIRSCCGVRRSASARARARRAAAHDAPRIARPGRTVACGRHGPAGRLSLYARVRRTIVARVGAPLVDRRRETAERAVRALCRP